eukprot:jgi/Tetstr1/454822/TSEL_041702.t1
MDMSEYTGMVFRTVGGEVTAELSRLAGDKVSKCLNGLTTKKARALCQQQLGFTEAAGPAKIVPQLFARHGGAMWAPGRSMRKAVRPLLLALLLLLMGGCVGLPGGVVENRQRLQSDGGRFATGDALLRSGAFAYDGGFYGMYGAVAYAAHHPRGWEAVPDGAGSSSYLSSASFYGGAIGQPPARPRPPPPPIVLQISSVFFTAALLDFDGRELALDPQEFEDFRALYMDAISRIPELLNLQTYQATVIHRVMLVDGVTPNIDTEMQFAAEGEAETFARVLRGLGGTNELGFGAVQFLYVSTGAPAWPPPDERVTPSPPPSPPPPPPNAPPPPPPPRRVAAASKPAPSRLPPVPATPVPTPTSTPDHGRLNRGAMAMEDLDGGGLSGAYGIPAMVAAAGAGVGCQLDRFGGCCVRPSQLDAKAECCSVAVDECGVCGGQGSTCALAANVTVGLSAELAGAGGRGVDRLLTLLKQSVSRLFHDYALDALEQIEVEHVVDRRRALHGAALWTMTLVIWPLQDGEHSPGAALPEHHVMRERMVAACAEKRAWRGLTLTAYEGSWRMGVCGNGVCELGEMDGRCAEDCPPVWPCPQPTHVTVGVAGQACAGRGRCASASGTCVCQAGHTGRFCEMCAPGFAPASGHCVPDGTAQAGTQSPDIAADGVTPGWIRHTPAAASSPGGRAPASSEADAAHSQGGFAAQATRLSKGEAGLVVAIVVGAFAGMFIGLAAVAAVTYWAVTRKGRREGDTELAHNPLAADYMREVPPLQAAFSPGPARTAPPSAPARPQPPMPRRDLGPGGQPFHAARGSAPEGRPGMAQLYAGWPEDSTPPGPPGVQSHPDGGAGHRGCGEGAAASAAAAAHPGGRPGMAQLYADWPEDFRREGVDARAPAAHPGGWGGLAARSGWPRTAPAPPGSDGQEAARDGGRHGHLPAGAPHPEAGGDDRSIGVTPPPLRVPGESAPPALIQKTVGTETDVPAPAPRAPSAGSAGQTRAAKAAPGEHPDARSTAGSPAAPGLYRRLVLDTPRGDCGSMQPPDAARTSTALRPSTREAACMAVPMASVSTMTEAAHHRGAPRREAHTAVAECGLTLDPQHPRREDGSRSTACQTEHGHDEDRPPVAVSSRFAEEGPQWASRHSNAAFAEPGQSHPASSAGKGAAFRTPGLDPPQCGEDGDFGLRIAPSWRDGDLHIRPPGGPGAPASPMTINVTLHHHSHSGAHYHDDRDHGGDRLPEAEEGPPARDPAARATREIASNRHRHPHQNNPAASSSQKRNA